MSWIFLCEREVDACLHQAIAVSSAVCGPIESDLAQQERSRAFRPGAQMGQQDKGVETNCRPKTGAPLNKGGQNVPQGTTFLYPSNLGKREDENQIQVDVVFFVYLSVLRFTTTKEAELPWDFVIGPRTLLLHPSLLDYFKVNLK